MALDDYAEFDGLGLAELTVRWRPLRRIAFWT